MDKDVRDLWKTFPWIGLGFTAFLSVLFVSFLAAGRIRVLNSRYGGAYYIEYADEPTDYITIICIMAALLIGMIYYCVLRLSRRRRFLQEDREDTLR